MSVKLRFVRIGKKNHPAYRLCAIESRKARDGQYIENIGFYDPYIADDQKKIRFDRERAEHWLRVGAQPSQTVLDFFKREKIAGLIHPRKPKRRKKPRTVGASGSHHSAPGSHHSAPGSHDPAGGSHDPARGSHDPARGSHDPARSHHPAGTKPAKKPKPPKKPKEGSPKSAEPGAGGA